MYALSRKGFPEKSGGTCTVVEPPEPYPPVVDPPWLLVDPELVDPEDPVDVPSPVPVSVVDERYLIASPLVKGLPSGGEEVVVVVGAANVFNFRKLLTAFLCILSACGCRDSPWMRSSRSGRATSSPYEACR